MCRPLLGEYKCECLSPSYSGRHCEIKSNGLVVREVFVKSFSYIAILAMIIVVMFIVIMDILKYCFGIDPVEIDRDYLRRKKRRTVVRKSNHVNIRTNKN